jgi:hypothetical protein
VRKTALQGASELSGKAAAWVGGWFSQPSTADSCNSTTNSGRAGNSNKRGRGKRSSGKRSNSKARADVYLTAALVFIVVALAGSSLAALCSMSSSGSGSVMTSNSMMPAAAPLPLASSTGLVYSGPLPAAFSASVMCPGNHTAASWAAHCASATPAGSYTAGCAATLVSVAKDAAAADGITLWNVTRMNATQQAAAAVPAQQCAPFAPLLPLCPVSTPTAADVTCALQAGQRDSLLWHLAHHHANQQQQQRAEGVIAVSAPGEEASSSACDMQALTHAVVLGSFLQVRLRLGVATHLDCVLVEPSVTCCTCHSEQRIDLPDPSSLQCGMLTRLVEAVGRFACWTQQTSAACRPISAVHTCTFSCTDHNIKP